jgi:hypothetical protein
LVMAGSLLEHYIIAGKASQVRCGYDADRMTGGDEGARRQKTMVSVIHSVK